VLITFQYEKLPRYCFDCGKIWHGANGCSQKRGGGVKLESGKQYGTWLRVPSPRRRGDQMRSWGQSSAAKEWDEALNSASKGQCCRYDGSRTSEEGGVFSSPWSETTSNMARAAAKGKTTVVEEVIVREKGANSGKGAKHGEELGAFTAEMPISVEGVSSKLNGNNTMSIYDGACKGGDIAVAVKELNLEGKESLGSIKCGPKGKTDEFGKRMGGIMNSLDSHGKPTAGHQRGKEPSVGNFNHGHMVQTWKRRARAGQCWPNAQPAIEARGKRKTSGFFGNDDSKQYVIRRSKRSSVSGLKLRDEEDVNENGSGMAGSGSQPRRPE
jgi:hypothetical protein